MVAEKSEESLGAQMLYDICECLRERLSDMNEKILAKLAELDEQGSLDNALKSFQVSRDAPLNFTPVTQETFKRWCDEYKERMLKIKMENKTEMEVRPSGRELFLMKKNVIQEINVEEDEEEFKDEEGKEDEEDEDFEYDQALYVRDEEDEEVDFD